ncbi:hypothetical protein SAMN06297280_2909 [Arsukibacterium tuosuense]|uniref:Uncharacterized protein n=1 Tax=Arsukibacterium tuosuense TaxID=1323745 RepID=A0A285J697_9GAMM|nr:hypothetical protein [Arsukibacterium tuosuense]SNY55583.1 hypothetical protein SAMN06297280_2909 [Arsukibacterium tuosuense]
MKMLFGVVSLLFSLSAVAQFQLTGNGSYTLQDGETIPFQYGFGYTRKEGQFHFSAGKQSLVVSSLPQKYSLALILQNEDEVWIPDFVNAPISSFDYEISGFEIKLTQEPELKDGRGNFVLHYDGGRYRFNRGPGQVNFIFNDEGIARVEIKGMFKLPNTKPQE